jgi:hypothetical protein
VGIVEFLVNGASVGSVPVSGDGPVSVGPLAGGRLPGNYAVTARFVPASGGNFLGSSANATLVVAKEGVKTEYTGDQFVETAGPSVPTAPVRLGATLTQEADGTPGDLTLARVRFELYSSENVGTVPDHVVNDVAVNSAGSASALVSLGADSWTVKVLVPGSNGYWAASPIGVSSITVAPGDKGQGVSGGGWIADRASKNGKSTFSFNVKGGKGATKGQVQHVFTGSDGYVYRVRSSSWTGGGLSFSADPSKASFVAKVSVQKMEAASGRVVSTGTNYQIVVDLVDGQIARSDDRIAISILTPTGEMWRQVGTRSSPVSLGGGNVAVRSR